LCLNDEQFRRKQWGISLRRSKEIVKNVKSAFNKSNRRKFCATIRSVMKFWRSKISATVLLAVLLPILLGVLAALQYQWLSEISRAERERLQTRLQADAQRFAADFNNEITRIYFSFQIDSTFWQNNQPALFAQRYEDWRRQTKFPNLVSSVYFVERVDGNFNLHSFNPTLRDFQNADWNEQFQSIRARIEEQLNKQETKIPFTIAFRPHSIVESIPALVVPVIDQPEIETEELREGNIRFRAGSPFETNKFIVLFLNSETIRDEIIPQLAKRNFGENSAFNFSVTERSAPDKIIYESSKNSNLNQPDASVSFFDVTPENSNILILGGLPRTQQIERQTTIIQEQNEITTVRKTANANLPNTANGNRYTVRVNKTSERVAKTGKPEGCWELKVQHADGSLENFVGRAKWRNLGLSFGILALLGASVVLLMVSTNRAKRAAQRQIDFVSSVSHEFRTPVAVICSAGDNLADGIVSSPPQIEKYGKLIRREGNRLTEMVEQILEFAGARSGRKTYSFQPVEVAPLIAEVLADCQPVLEEKGFEIVQNISENLPVINADAKALRLALQNLVNNSVKYSNGSRWIEIKAAETDKDLVLSVADKGIGIERTDLKHIFEPFYRGKSVVEAQIHGNGLGLSLVRQIVEAHKGKIKVESAPHKGSKFIIEIPKSTAL
jgi:signal transduction histidine kinase